jgi:hypothetical protein
VVIDEHNDMEFLGGMRIDFDQNNNGVVLHCGGLIGSGGIGRGERAGSYSY